MMMKNVTLRATYTTYSQLPEEHRMIYEMCAKFADEELMPHAGEWDKKHEYPTHAIAKLVRTHTHTHTHKPRINQTGFIVGGGEKKE
jgi:alkylation response protein AidB-like acyl-CoA dehydrogenase